MKGTIPGMLEYSHAVDQDGEYDEVWFALTVEGVEYRFAVDVVNIEQALDSDQYYSRQEVDVLKVIGND